VYLEKRVAVVVPAYNESGQIQAMLAGMPDLVDDIVVVDDSSQDDTAEKVRASGDPRVHLVTHERNGGVGAAIATGHKWCQDREVDIAVVMAGDGQMDPDDLIPILEPVARGEVDFSKGNRLVYKDAYHMVPKVRFFGNAVLSMLTKIASGYYHIADSQSGYTACNRRVIETIDWDRMYKRYGQPNDLLVRLNVADLRVRDVPIRPVYNIGEKSGIRIPTVLVTISWLLLRMFVWRLKEKYIIRDFHPLVLFYGLGFLLIALSTVFFVRLVTLWIGLGSAPELTAIALMFSASSAMQTLFFAMWFDMEMNRHLHKRE